MKQPKTILFIILSILFVYQSHGKHHIGQQYDSIGIKTIVKRSNYRLRENHRVDVLIDNIIYQPNASIYQDTSENDMAKNIIYLSDTINPNSKIKIKVYTSDVKDKPRIMKVKSKTFRFNFSESKKNIVYINYKKQIYLFSKRDRGCCGNFW